jgi:hypothetical protein
MNITATTLSAGYDPLHAFGHSLNVMKQSWHECATPQRNALPLQPLAEIERNALLHPSVAKSDRASMLGLDDLHQLHVDHLA